MLGGETDGETGSKAKDHDEAVGKFAGEMVIFDVETWDTTSQRCLWIDMYDQIFFMGNPANPSW